MKLTDANLFILVVSIARRAERGVVLIFDVVDPPGRRRGGVSTERLAVIAAEIVDAHFHSVKTRIQTFSAFVYVYQDGKKRKFCKSTLGRTTQEASGIR